MIVVINLLCLFGLVYYAVKALWLRQVHDLRLFLLCLLLTAFVFPALLGRLLSR